jgi:hypothetical protein
MLRDWRKGLGFVLGLWIAFELLLPLLGPD